MDPGSVKWIRQQVSLLPETDRAEIEVPDWPQFLRGCLAFRQPLEDELSGAPRMTAEFVAGPRDQLLVEIPGTRDLRLWDRDRPRARLWPLTATRGPTSRESR